ncbi:hypothetical protein [Streptomyces albogriseolus]|uniref:hypothetical protein n=1 Tax=Streptomyces albogriseolus TaxID=1887 RepID=UPI0034614A2B
MDTELEALGITEAVMDKAMAAMTADLKPLAERHGVSVMRLLNGWHDDISGAYFYGYTSAALAGKEGRELSQHAAVAILYAFGQSSNPAVRAHAEELRAELARKAYRLINDQARAAGSNPTYRPLACTECSAGEYRDDLPADPKWDAEDARWRCKNCGRPFDLRDLQLEAGEDWAIRDHVLGLIDKPEQEEEE